MSEKEALKKIEDFMFEYEEVLKDEFSNYEEKESANEFVEASTIILNYINELQKRIDEYEELFNALEDYYEITIEDIEKCIKEDI